MAQLAQTFDPASAPQEDRNFDLIPNSWQPMQVIESDVQPTKQGGGQMLVLTWEIIDGPHAKRRIWQRINIINQNAKAQEMGQRDLGSICKALNLGPIQDTSVLEFKPVLGRVGVEKGDGQFEDKNTVKGWKPYASGAVPQAAGPQNAAPQQPAQTGQAATGGASSRPWVK